MKLLKNWRKKKILTMAGLILLVIVSFWIGSMFGAGKGAAPAEPAAHEHDEKEATIWTCSMHPQIKMPKPGQCPICFMDLIPLETGVSGAEEGSTRLTMSENAKILAGISTAPAVRRSMAADISLTGKVDYDETRLEMITARIDGRIDRLYVDYTGVPVKRGDHLAQIYSPELISLQKELLEASNAASQVTSDENSDMVNQSITRVFEAAKEKLRLLGFSEKELSNILSRGTTTDYMTIRANQVGVVVKKLVEEGSYVKKGAPLFHIADLKKLWVKLDAYESDLMWLRLGQKVDFTVEAWPGNIFAGTISFIDPIVNPKTRTVKIRVITDNKGNKLKPDMFVRATVKADVSKSGGVKSGSLKGKWISPMHPQIVKDRPGTCDICGMPLVRAEELGYVTSGFEEVNPLVIPATAPLITGERAVVYVEVDNKEGPTYEGREVVLGPRVGGYYIVKSGLAEGEMVVVNGAFKIDGELQIRARPSMMNPEGGVAAAGHKSRGHTKAEKVKIDLSQLSAPVISDRPVSKAFNKQMSNLFTKYFAVTEALTKDDLKVAKKGFKDLKAQIKKVKPEKGKQYRAWKTASKGMVKILTHIAHISGLPDAREMFEKISIHIITLEKHYGHSDDEKHFLAFCPMAFGNKGAYWLQAHKEIKNPYYGPKMLKCGEVKEVYERR